MSRYEDFFQEEQKKVQTRKEVASKIMNYWKADLQKAISLNMTIEDKVSYLMSTGVARKIMAIYGMKEKVLKETLENYIKTPNDEWLYNKILNLSESHTIKTELEKLRKPLTDVIPKKVLDFLPKKLVVDVDPQGQILEIYSRYANKDKNIGVKIEKQKAFIYVKNKFEDLLHKGLVSRDNRIKMMSLIIAVMYDTGIRPGDMETGLSYTSIETQGPETEDEKKPKPARELVDTFGAISLEPEHFKVLNGITNLAFYGKSGVFNKAQISSTLLNKVIKDVIVDFADEVNTGKPLFSVDGVPFNAGQLQNFFTGLLKTAGMEDISGHSMTDLRKLKSSTVLHKVLVESKKDLEEKLLKIENVFSKKAYTTIATIIAEHIEKAVEKAEVALNHTSMNMTINSYINPQILLDFFSRSGDISDNFGDLLLSDGTLKFNVQEFVLNASQSRFADNGGWESVIESGESLGLPEQSEFAKEFGYMGRRYAATKKKRVVIDRIEGKKAICYMGRTLIELPLSFLPLGVKEGMTVEFIMDLKNTSTKDVKNKINQLTINDNASVYSI